MTYPLSELINIHELRILCERFMRLTGFPTVILDSEGNLLVSTGWRDICSRFHHTTPETAAKCRASDLHLANRLRRGETFALHRCENGLYDVAIPLLMDGMLVGSLYSGQFLLAPPDEASFRQQAVRFGFDETSYLEALAGVPVISEERIKQVMDFLRQLAAMIGEMGRAARDARRASLVVEKSPVVLLTWRPAPGWPVEYVTDNIAQFGYTPREFLSGTISLASLLHPEDLQRVSDEIRASSADGTPEFRLEGRILTRDGRTRWVGIRTLLERDPGGAPQAYQGVMLDITERKETELALQLTQFAVDNGREAAYWTGPDGRFLYVNQASCRALGYTREELLTMSVSDIRPEYPPERWPSHWQELRERKTFSFETTHRRKDGSVFPVEITVNHMLFGGREYNFAFARDMSERRRIEKQLLLTQFAFDNNADACFWINGRGEITSVNDAACHSLGYSREELVTMTVADIDPDWQGDRQVLSRKHLELRERGTPIFESRHRTRSGEIFPVEICNNFVEFEGVLYNCAFARNISARKRTEKALRLSNRVVESSPVVLFRWGPSREWPVEMVSRNVNQFGYTAAEFLSGAVSYASIIHPDDLERTVREIELLGAVGTPQFQLEYRILTKRGEPRWVSERTVLERNEAGEINCYEGVVIDITERKKMEEELVKAQKLESVGLLAGGIAHDFNNILTAILGSASLAKALIPQEDRLHTHLGNIETAAFRAKDLTQQFLTFSKGGAPIKKPLSAAELVRSYTQLALSGLKSDCELNIPEDLRIVEVDEGQISQVINNLMINADQAMPQGGTIRVDCRNVVLDEANDLPLAGGEYVRIGVSDQGVGIPREHQEKIFDPYFTTKQEGQGLGLASAYAIMKKHAGHITVESEPGSGATFTLYLPACEASAPPPPAETIAVTGGSGRILVMDDEPVVSLVVQGMLEYLGYEVAFARDGEEALTTYGEALASGCPFDAVIMDLTIPGGMGGKETIRQMLELDPNVRAIVSSGYSNDPVMAHYRDYGFAGVVVKPYHLGELSDQLGRLLENRGSTRPRPES